MRNSDDNSAVARLCRARDSAMAWQAFIGGFSLMINAHDAAADIGDSPRIESAI